MNSRPAVAIGKDRLSAVDFSGTIFVETDSDDDFVGFVFGFQDNSNFYVVYSAKDGRPNGQGIRPWRITRVSSKTGKTALPWIDRLGSGTCFFESQVQILKCGTIP